MPRLVTLSFVLLLSSTSSVVAQFETAALVGTIVDSSGAPVADAVVTATHQDTGVSQTRRGDDRGSFEFDNPDQFPR